MTDKIFSPMVMEYKIYFSANTIRTLKVVDAAKCAEIIEAHIDQFRNWLNEEINKIPFPTEQKVES